MKSAVFMAWMRLRKDRLVVDAFLTASATKYVNIFTNAFATMPYSKLKANRCRSGRVTEKV